GYAGPSEPAMARSGLAGCRHELERATSPGPVRGRNRTLVQYPATGPAHVGADHPTAQPPEPAIAGPYSGRSVRPLSGREQPALARTSARPGPDPEPIAD